MKGGIIRWSFGLVAACSACGDETQEVASATIGVEGGVVGNEAAGVSLTFPPGALAEPTTITLSRKVEGVPGFALAGPVYVAEPAGLELARPATFALTVPPGVPVTLYWEKPDGSEYEPIAAASSSGLVIGSTTHFSESFASCDAAADPDAPPPPADRCACVSEDGEPLCFTPRTKAEWECPVGYTTFVGEEGATCSGYALVADTRHVCSCSGNDTGKDLCSTPFDADGSCVDSYFSGDAGGSCFGYYLATDPNGVQYSQGESGTLGSCSTVTGERDWTPLPGTLEDCARATPEPAPPRPEGACGEPGEPHAGLDDDAEPAPVTTPEPGPVGPGSVSLAPGEEALVGPVVVTADLDDLNAEVELHVASVAAPVAVPEGYALAGDVLDISVDDPTAVDAPLTIQMRYDPTGMPAGAAPVVLHYDEATGYTPATVLAHDPTTGTVTFDTSTFSHFAPGWVVGALPASYPDPTSPDAFDVQLDTFPFANYAWGTLSGNCMGMSTMVVWLHAERRHLANDARLAGRMSVERLEVLAAMSQVMMSGYWNDAVAKTYVIADQGTVAAMKQELVRFGPFVLAVHGNGQYNPAVPAIPDASHAIVVYGYDQQYFLAWDPNLPGETVWIAYSPWGLATSIVRQNGAPVFTNARYLLLAASTHAKAQGFEELLAEADQGFPTASRLTIDAPASGSVLGRVHEVRGTLDTSFASTNPSLYAFVGGEFYPIPVQGNTFTGHVALFSGPSMLALFGVPRAPRFEWREGGLQVLHIENLTPPAELAVMLRWNLDRSDLDLYLVAPEDPPGTPIGERTIWNGQPYAEFDTRVIDNAEGYGPELAVVSLADPEGPPYVLVNGTYAVRAHLFRHERGPSTPIEATVSLRLLERRRGSRVVSCRFEIAHANPNNNSPTATGDDWRDVAWITVEGAPHQPRITRIMSGGRVRTNAAGQGRLEPFCWGADGVQPAAP